MTNSTLAHPVPILLVDDDERNLLALESILAAPDYLLVKARNGDEALWAVHDQDFAVIVLDVQMPAMDGFEVARLIKGRKKTSHVPILFLSAHYQAENDALAGYGAGAVDYLTKPCNPHILASKIAFFAELYRKTRALEAEIAERQEAEKRVHELNSQLEAHVRELKAANAELEGFTFATSHDLRGPLGRINSFSTLLERTCRDRLEGDSLFFLDIIRQNASRLTLLVDDLLSHARIAQQTLELRSIPISDAVQKIVRDKMQEAVEMKGEIRADVPPAKVLADAYALGQALDNLVENAIKYSSSVASPRIEVGGKLVGDRFRLWVRDNGIGFKMEYHDKIFQMFQRLHTYAEYAGSGMGLALVKRAVERMGGMVWAESEPGKGATFFLELRAVP